MVEILVEVDDGPARVRTVVRAGSIRRAVDIASARYPDADVRVVYPIDPEAFFIRDPAAPMGLVGSKMPEKVAG